MAYDEGKLRLNVEVPASVKHGIQKLAKKTPDGTMTALIVEWYEKAMQEEDERKAILQSIRQKDKAK